MRPPTLERMGVLHLRAWEVALGQLAVNGRGLPADAVWLLQAIAVRSPRTAAACPRVLAACGPEVAAAVLRLAGASPGSGIAPVPAGPAGSAGRVAVADAARALGITPRRVRALCQSGELEDVITNPKWPAPPASPAD